MTTTICFSCLRQRNRLLLRYQIQTLQNLRASHTSTTTPTAPPPPATQLYQYHWDTNPATPSQLLTASEFFAAHRPTRLWTATEWRKLPHSTIPEVAFLGRSNVGKSSLLNTLMDAEICYTGPRPGKTKEMHAWGLREEKYERMGSSKKKGVETGLGCQMAVLDMPGYGKGSRADWGEEIMRYLRARKQLRRAFLLIDAMHGPKRTDLRMLALLRRDSIPHQVLLSKVDRLKGPEGTLQERLEELRALVQPRDRSGLEGLGEILCTSALREKRRRPAGIDAVRWAVLVAAGLDGSPVVESHSTDTRCLPASTTPGIDLSGQPGLKMMSFTPFS